MLMKLHSSELEQRLEFVDRVATAARGVTLDAFLDPPEAENKLSGSVFDPVTATDLKTEKLIRKFLNDEFPQDGIVGEEYDDVASQNGWNWCIDPIDGTRTFIDHTQFRCLRRHHPRWDIHCWRAL